MPFAAPSYAMNQELEPITNIRGRTPGDVIDALSVLAACGGSAYKAEQRTGITQQTLKNWRKIYPLRYAKAQDEYSRILEEEQNRFYREHITNLNEAEALALEKLIEKIHTGE